MKKKLILVSIGIFLCLLIGISSVRAESKTLQPNQYWGLGKNMGFDDTLNFQINSNNPINVYIVDSYQLSQYQDDPQDIASIYYKEWKGVLLLTDSFTAPEDETYYVLMINPSDISSASISVSASIDYAEPEKSISIYSPRSTDTFENGCNDIHWSTTGSISSVRIELYAGSSFLEVITDMTYDDGSYSWCLSSSDIYDGSNYRIRISDYYDDSIYDFSDYFTIEIEEDEDVAVRNSWWLLIVIPSIIIISGVIGYIIYKRRKQPKEVIPITREIPVKEEPVKSKEMELPRITHCPTCGVKIKDKIGKYCSECGAPIK